MRMRLGECGCFWSVPTHHMLLYTCTCTLQVSREHRPQSQSLFTRVPFQEESDNIKNFPNMKVFHAFKKQRYIHVYMCTCTSIHVCYCGVFFVRCRDSFYSILRDWETHHNSPNWNFQSALQDKIRSTKCIYMFNKYKYPYPPTHTHTLTCTSNTLLHLRTVCSFRQQRVIMYIYVLIFYCRLLMSQPAELCSLDHLASLFQKQLLEVHHTYRPTLPLLYTNFLTAS